MLWLFSRRRAEKTQQSDIQLASRLLDSGLRGAANAKLRRALSSISRIACDDADDTQCAAAGASALTMAVLRRLRAGTPHKCTDVERFTGAVFAITAAKQFAYLTSQKPEKVCMLALTEFHKCVGLNAGDASAASVATLQAHDDIARSHATFGAAIERAIGQWVDEPTADNIDRLAGLFELGPRQLS